MVHAALAIKTKIYENLCKYFRNRFNYLRKMIDFDLHKLKLPGKTGSIVSKYYFKNNFTRKSSIKHFQ